WYVAWRYLTRLDRSRASRVVLSLGVLCMLAGAALLLAPEVFHLRSVEDWYFGRPELRRILQATGFILIVLPGFVLFFFGLFLWRFSIFTCISMFVIGLGVSALILVLSVMSGFETDLKLKILGQHAEVVVSQPDKAWTGWASQLQAVRGLPG